MHFCLETRTVTIQVTKENYGVIMFVPLYGHLLEAIWYLLCQGLAALNTAAASTLSCTQPSGPCFATPWPYQMVTSFCDFSAECVWNNLVAELQPGRGVFLQHDKLWKLHERKAEVLGGEKPQVVMDYSEWKQPNCADLFWFLGGCPK